MPVNVAHFSTIVTHDNLCNKGFIYKLFIVVIVHFVLFYFDPHTKIHHSPGRPPYNTL